MKTKLVLSLSALTMIFTACETAEPLPLDCMSIENGTAIIDDCGDCHKFTAYNYVTHAVREVNDTTTEVLGENEMFASPNNPMNPAWNLCPDCMGVSNGVAVVDSCGDCQGAFLYNFTTHNPMDIVMLGGDTSGAAAANAATTDSIICVLPEHPMNSYWNSGCTDCDDILNGVAVVDSCGDCQGAFLYNFTTHNPMDIVMLGGDTTGAAAAAAATTDSIICVLPEHPMNSYWNSGCK